MSNSKNIIIEAFNRYRDFWKQHGKEWTYDIDQQMTTNGAFTDISVTISVRMKTLSTIHLLRNAFSVEELNADSLAQVYDKILTEIAILGIPTIYKQTILAHRYGHVDNPNVDAEKYPLEPTQEVVV
jgi:hypothetical protein